MASSFVLTRLSRPLSDSNTQLITAGMMITHKTSFDSIKRNITICHAGHAILSSQLNTKTTCAHMNTWALPPFYTSTRSYERSIASAKLRDPEAENVFEIDRQKIQTSSRQKLITNEEIVERQKRLVRDVCEWLEDKSKGTGTAVILIPNTNTLFHANTNIPVHDGKQNSDFTYLTGLHPGWADQSTSDCVLVLLIDQQSKQLRSLMFAPVKTKSEQVWHGRDFAQLYRDQLAHIVDEVQPLSGLVDFVNNIVRHDRQNFFVSRNGLQFRPELALRLKHFIQYSSDSFSPSGDHSTIVIRDASPFIDRMRSIKSRNEIAALKRVGRIGAKALATTISWTRQMMDASETNLCLESHIASKFEFESRLLGAQKLSFPSICASSQNSTVVHYGQNASTVAGWVLTDVGCEDVDGYCCDISRTWPSYQVSHELQKQFYQALVAVQRELLKSIEVGRASLQDLQSTWSTLLVELLVLFDVFEVSLSRTEVTSLSKRLCPHLVSHYIGLDIHDTPNVSRSQPLQAGMCFSIEPGVYFPPSSDDAQNLPLKKQFRGFGLRIEDNYVIESAGAITCLTNECPTY